MSLTVEDLEKLQTQLTDAHLDYRTELVDGKIIIMGLSDYVSEVIVARLITFLNMWVFPRSLGYVTGSSAGFRLPDGNLRGPDVSFVPAQKMRQAPHAFAEIVPDLAIEVRSVSDNIKPLVAKLEKFLELGSQVGILVDPKNLTVTVYRPNCEPLVLTNDDTLAIPELLPGWELAIAEIWPPVFDEV
ncbi:Uma2 family endonuclease [Roseofilum sp. BLCC_M91]|uniref:Uma2 family endonuclease n=1 Tax=Roseofilum halophilum BLCC-M91 TaxID=3022259 RepID=A0ABT7BMZ2_9CYAN|nr:Uma2 family endonuclease [Roseofilum halophilum]MDJ1179841.1 Uma2 family endonuclease [Roseofilum halophilum BLCC-M91]